ncbi:MAG: hypothetical protein IJ190_10565, partial [Prevotella sp.]|nr:hypothetical protein [Prevotella sp.]
LFALLIDFSSPQDSDNLIATLRERLSPAERESISTPKKLHFYLESLVFFSLIRTFDTSCRKYSRSRKLK